MNEPARTWSRRSSRSPTSDPDLAQALICATAFPYGPAFADTVARGDYINLFATFDLTYPRLKQTLLPRDPVGRRGRQADTGAGRSVLPALHLRPADRRLLRRRRTEAAARLPPVADPGAADRRRSADRCCRWCRRRRPRRWLPPAQCTSSQIFAGPYGAEARRRRPAASAAAHRQRRRHRHREVVADADPLRPKPADHLHDRVDRRRGGDAVRLHAGAHPARRRPHRP